MRHFTWDAALLSMWPSWLPALRTRPLFDEQEVCHFIMSRPMNAVPQTGCHADPLPSPLTPPVICPFWPVDCVPDRPSKSCHPRTSGWHRCLRKTPAPPSRGSRFSAASTTSNPVRLVCRRDVPPHAPPAWEAYLQPRPLVLFVLRFTFSPRVTHPSPAVSADGNDGGDAGGLTLMVAAFKRRKTLANLCAVVAASAEARGLPFWKARGSAVMIRANSVAVGLRDLCEAVLQR